MSKESLLYLIENERRTFPTIQKNPTNGEKRLVARRYISADRLRLILDSKTREQDKLWDQLQARDAMKFNLTKLSFGIFSLFVTGLIAVFSISANPDTILKTEGFVILFGLALVGMALMNLALIKHMISHVHSRVLFLRQINCLRHAIDGCNFALIEGHFPENSAELRKEETLYHRVIGKHRKLPITNKAFRIFHKKVFESADNMTIIIITLLTTCLALLPIIYMWEMESSNIVGAVSSIFVLVFISFVIGIMKSAKVVLSRALDFHQDKKEADLIHDDSFHE